METIMMHRIVLTCLLCLQLAEAVNRPPHIYMQPTIKDIYYKPGESVEIPCIANGIPRPQYSWKRNGEQYNPSGQDDRVVQLPNQGTIVFNRPESKDEGIFQCFADNGYGISASVKVNLREAKLKKFAYEPARNHRVDNGMDLTLPCTPPQSYPPADVYWVIKEVGGSWRAINFDKRVSMDLEGKLRFTNVRTSDYQDGKAYTCMAINYFMRDNAIGPEHTVEVLGSTEQKRPAHLLWTSPSDQFFIKGSVMKLKCIFAGNPTPDVYWDRIDGAFPDRASFKSFGQELQIKDVQMSDAGQYECMGLNTETSQRASKAFDVRIESAPYWVDEPVSVEASIDEKATFICRAFADPEPHYSWYINGVPLEDRANQEGVRDPRIYKNDRFFKPNEHNVTLTRLTLEDFMNIQCNASNKHGYVWADVYLNVLAEKPTIIKPPPATKIVAEGQSVEIDCVVTGKPDPIVTWYRDFSLITGGRFKIQPNGNLRIDNVVMADAGDYRCQASNKYASDVTSPTCKMQIRRKTIIEQFPLDLEVTAGYDAKFTCSGSTDFDEAKNMRIFWEKDDKLISTTEQRMSLNYQDNSLTISGTIVRDSGVYTCVITNGLDEDRAYAILTVKDRPDPPSGVQVERCRDSTADIKWIKGIENNAPVQYFIVQYNTSFNPDQWVFSKQLTYTQNTASIDLLPWSNYTFRVVATNKIGASSPSFHTSRVCLTNPDRPRRNPQNIRAVGDTRNFLKIEWTPMTQLEHSGPGFKYQLTVKERGSTRSDTYNIDNWRNHSMSVPCNKVYTPYLVKLQAKNSIGFSYEDPDEKTLYSYEEIPKVSPSDVTVTDIGSTTAKLTWKWDSLWMEEEGEMNYVQGRLHGFRIQFWRANEKLSTFREIEVPLSAVTPSQPPPSGQRLTSEYLLSNLSPYSQMVIQVCVTNSFYVGTPSEQFTFQTYEGVPGPVPFLQAQIKSSNSFFLIWAPPASEDRNGILAGYDITFQTVEGLELGAVHDRDEQINDPIATSAVLSGLLPNRKYRIYIYARTRYGRGEGVFIEAKTTHKAEIGTPQFSVEEITENSMNITWGPDANFGGTVVHYVEFRKEGSADWLKSGEEVLRRYKQLTGLERGTYYEIRVVAYDGYYRAFSETLVVGTVGFAAAKSIASNYGWFIGMCLGGLICIGIAIFIYCIHKKRKGVEEEPKKHKGFMLRPLSFRRKQHEDYDAVNRYEPRDDNGYEDHDKDRGYRDSEYEKRRDDDDYARGYDKDRDSYRDDYDRDRDSYRDDDRHYDDYDDDRDGRYDDYDDRRYDNDDRYDDDHYDDDEYDERDRLRGDDDRYSEDEYGDDEDPPPSYAEVKKKPSIKKKPAILPKPKPRKRKSFDGEKEALREPSKFDKDGRPRDDVSEHSVV